MPNDFAFSIPPSLTSVSYDPASNDIATILAGRLHCAVLAMRFPVDDEFSIELAEKFYALLADDGQPLPRAVALALRRLTESARL